MHVARRYSPPAAPASGCFSARSNGAESSPSVWEELLAERRGCLKSGKLVPGMARIEQHRNRSIMLIRNGAALRDLEPRAAGPCGKAPGTGMRIAVRSYGHIGAKGKRHRSPP